MIQRIIRVQTYCVPSAMEHLIDSTIIENKFTDEIVHGDGENQGWGPQVFLAKLVIQIMNLIVGVVWLIGLPKFIILLLVVD